MAKSDWKAAKKLLRLSNSLREDERTDTALRVVSTKVKRVVVRKRKPVKPVVKNTPEVIDDGYESAMRGYFSSLKDGQLLTAKQHIEKAVALSPNNEQSIQYKTSLDQLIDKTVGQHVENGKYLYSIGDIDSAIQDWQAAYKLAPNNEALKERLEKAQRFQDRYESLK